MPKANLLFRLARKANPLMFPSLYPCKDINIALPIPAKITFSPLEQPVSCAESLIAGHLNIVSTTETGISPPAIITNVVGATPGQSEQLELPAIESLFVPIAPPKLAGKVYMVTKGKPTSPSGLAGGLHTDAPSSLPNRPLPGNSPGAPSGRRVCQHGNTQWFCPICHAQPLPSQARTPEAARQPTFTKQPAIGYAPKEGDLFDQIWFALQPSVLGALTGRDVLPNKKKPYDFQVAGIRWLIETPQALLADEMGLGKTIQAIMAMRALFQKGKLQKVLVICPLSVAQTWMSELAEWAPELRSIRINNPADLRAYQWQTPAEVYVVSYDTLRSDLSSSRVSANAFDLCIVDEAQNIKNPSAKRSQAIKQVKSKYRWALTGTPLENRIEDTLSIFGFLKPDLVDHYSQGGYPISTSEFRKEIGPYTLRRTVDDVALDLPACSYQTHWLELGDKQRRTYQNAEEAGVSGLMHSEGQVTRIHIFALINKLKQICNLDEESGKSCKLDFLKEQLDELTSNGEKALVFSQYPGVTLRKIESSLAQYAPLMFDGSLNETTRNQYVHRFQQENKNKIMLLGVKSGGTGLTLTRANHVFHFDHWWNPATVDQASKRVHRIGQQRPVFVQSLFTVDTIEERIYKLLENKRILFNDVFGNISSNEEMEKSLTDEELFGLFGLAPPHGSSTRTTTNLTTRPR